MAQPSQAGTHKLIMTGKEEHRRMSEALRPRMRVLLVASYSSSANLVRLSLYNAEFRFA
jgi:hypothetical protein